MDALLPPRPLEDPDDGKPTDQPDANELLDRIAAQDPAAGAEVFLRYSKSILHFLWRRTGDRYAAEDLCQDVFVRFLGGSAGFTGRFPSLARLLFGIASYCYIDWVRQRCRRGAPVSDEAISSWPADLADPIMRLIVVEEAIRQRQTIQEVMETIRLSPVAYQIIMLRFSRELSFADIAAIVGMTEPACRQTVCRGLARMTEAVEVACRDGVRVSARVPLTELGSRPLTDQGSGAGGTPDPLPKTKPVRRKGGAK